MDELDFERRLERYFGQAPQFSDAGAFAERVERRLDRGWATRRWLIGTAGVVGGVIGASQLLVSNVFGRIESASEGSAKLVSVGLNQLAPQLEWLATSSLGGVVWAVALAVVAMGFVLSRVIEEI